MSYADFLASKRQLGGQYGFEDVWLPEFLFPFQADLVRWAVERGRAAIFADCGLGKTAMQLVWAENMALQANRPILICTPLAVSRQVVAEGVKFDIEVVRSRDGKVPPATRIIVTNYERLHLFDPADFCGMVCDESSILKNFNGSRKAIITEFMRRLPFRLLCTATAAPNDYTELGTSAEALGELGHMAMLEKFFRNNRNNTATGRAYGGGAAFILKPHASRDFWRWVCSWSRACRRPSDLGYDDDGFDLPPLIENEHLVETAKLREGMLFAIPAVGLAEEREERRRTIDERCARIAELVDTGQQALVWCHLNAESSTLAKVIDGAEEVTGSDDDDKKEARLQAFADGDLRVLVTKPRIGAWGLNLQRCNHLTFFPSHSYEQYYQGVRRCWRFGQERPVTVDVVLTEGARNTMRNLKAKAAKADRMFDEMMKHMSDAMTIEASPEPTTRTEVPSWL